MVVAKVKTGNFLTYVGTLAEVCQAMSDDQVPEHKVHIFWNGTNTTGWCKIL